MRLCLLGLLIAGLATAALASLLREKVQIDRALTGRS